jgi:hypothetical protein
MFERFTDRARRVVVLAQEEARLLDHNYIGTEHLLLGLIHEGEGVGAQALESLDISLESARAEVQRRIGHGAGMPEGHIPFTPRAKKVLELSLREALQLGHNYIGTEHILLGIVREAEGVGAEVLVALGADLSSARRAVIQLLAGYTGTIQAASAVQSAGRASGRRTRSRACAFCGRDLWDVERYAESSGAAVCSECIDAAHEALHVDQASRAVVLPPRAYGEPKPPVEDITAISGAFAAALERDPDSVVDGLRLMELADELAARHGDKRAECHVERIRLLGTDRAEVRFWLLVEPMGARFEFEGRAVREQGRWRVERETFLNVLRLGGVTLEE